MHTRAIVVTLSVPLVYGLTEINKLREWSLVLTRIGERGVPGAVRVAALWSAAGAAARGRGARGPGRVECGNESAGTTVREGLSPLGREARQSALSECRKNGFKIYENGSVI